MCFLFFLLLTVFSCKKEKLPFGNSVLKIDSVSVYIASSKDASKSYNQKLLHLKKAHKLLGFKKNNELKNKYLDTIVYRAYKLKDSTFFKQVNSERLQLSKKIKDSFGIAEYHCANGNYYLSKEQLDSAFYAFNLAKKFFEASNDDYKAAKVLYSMAVIKNNIRDFTGCEKLIFDAIKVFEKENKNTSLYVSYNLLGVIFYKLKEFDKSLMYHNKALVYLEKTDKKQLYKITSFNNMGNVYRAMGNYNEAITNYNKALNDSLLLKNDPVRYARILNNLYYTKLLNKDTIGVETNLLKALKIRDSVNRISGIVLSKIHLAEYYSYKTDTLKAIKFATEAEKLAVEIYDNEDRLKALKLLSKLDTTKSTNYLETYIQLNDSLHAAERSIRNKFNRIAFETDTYIKTNKRLTKQNILITVFSAIAIILLIMLYFIRQQRLKNKELIFDKNQEKVNQEIYDLLLKQQSNLEEVRAQERHRISKELHDGILGKLFGARVGMGFLNLKGDEEDENDYKFYLNELHEIEKEIRGISHALQNNILKSSKDFTSIIEDYIANQSKAHGFNYSIHFDDTITWSDIPDKLKITLYRVVQEALLNVVKHSSANNIFLTFRETSKVLSLSINDDGKGFNTTKTKQGIGLKNMEARIQKLNGTFYVKSKLGKGTTIQVTVSI